MKTAFFPTTFLCVSLILAGAEETKATLIADWTFETSKPSGTGTDIGGLAPEFGVNASSSVGSGHHASSATGWSNPTGDSSFNSFSADHWAVNDYFQFKTTTTGYNTITVSFEQVSSGTGPTGFKLAYSTDGTTFTDISGDAYIVSSSAIWSATGTKKDSIENFDLSGISGVNNDTTLYFRLIDTTAPGGTSGTSRVDDFNISGTVIPVPEPGAWGALCGVGLIGICGLRTWRTHRT